MQPPIKFLEYKVLSAKIDRDDKVSSDSKLSLEHMTNGEFILLERIFSLHMTININSSSNDFRASVTIKALFFVEDVDMADIDNYLYISAPAIVYPYIRAYINTLTALSGLPPVSLPLINTISFADLLKANTVII